MNFGTNTAFGFGATGSGGGGGGGGTLNFISLTKAAADALIAADTLVPGSFYKITDRGDQGILLQATSVNTFTENGVRYMLCPYTYVPGMDINGNTWIGVWEASLSVNIGELAIWGGLVWENTSGNIGTADSDYELNAGDWTVITKAANPNNQYTPIQFGVSYDYANDWISKQWDDNCNIFGVGFGSVNELVELLHNPCDVSDWNYGTFNPLFVNNECIGFYNNIIEGKCYYNKILSGTINNNVCAHGVQNNSNNGNISGNACNSIAFNSNNDSIANNTSAVGDIIYNSCSSGIFENSNSGTISYNANLGGIYANSNNGEISQNNNNGGIEQNTNDGIIFLNSNNGFITNNSNDGEISYNNHVGVITNNSNQGQIKYNTIQGDITDNSNAGEIFENNNGGSIGRNENNGNINYNSNDADIGYNQANVTDITENANNGIIDSNSNTGTINNNANNGSIVNNLNTGLISSNKNNGNIDTNAASVVDIRDNVNNGHISTNLASSGTINITGNAHNSVISGTFDSDVVNGRSSDNSIAAYTAMGSSIKAQSVGLSISLITAAAGNLADGTARFIAVYIERPSIITGLLWFQNIQGNYVADNYNGVGLYRYSGGILTLVASSTDDGDIWKGESTTWQTKNFSAAYEAAPGVYFVGLLYNQSAQTTAPSIGSGDGGDANISTADFNGSTKLYSILAAQAALPTPQDMFGLTESGTRLYVALI